MLETNYRSVLGKRPLPGKRPCTKFQGVTVAASTQTYGISVMSLKCVSAARRRATLLVFSDIWIEILYYGNSYRFASCTIFLQWQRECSLAHLPPPDHHLLSRPRGLNDMQGIERDIVLRWLRTTRFCCRLKIVTAKSVEKWSVCCVLGV